MLIQYVGDGFYTVLRVRVDGGNRFRESENPSRRRSECILLVNKLIVLVVVKNGPSFQIAGTPSQAQAHAIPELEHSALPLSGRERKSEE